MEKKSLAILFSDIRGFTSYTAEKGDEEAYGLARTFLGLVEQQVQRHNGWVIKTYGDGAMTAFADVAQALSSAAEMQKALSEHGRAHPNKIISAGIGLTWGEVIRAGDDIFGNSVNLAKRLADYAKGGEVVFSSKARERLANTEGLHFLDLGNRELEGLGEERLYELIWRKELARLSDRDDQVTFVLTSDSKLVIEFKKDVYRQLEAAREELLQLAEEVSGLGRLVLRGMEHGMNRYLSEIIGEGVCETGVCSERPLEHLSATLDDEELTLTFGEQQTMKLSKDDFDVDQMRDFFSKLKALKHNSASES